MTTTTTTTKITTEVVLVTPELAAEWLTHNTHNRPAKRAVIDRIAYDIKNDDWLVDGNAIRFDWNGTLADGQNRLHAIILADRAVETTVTRGLDPAAQEVMDTGAVRRLPDILALRGEQNSTSLAAIVRQVDAWKAGSRRNLTKHVNSHAAMLHTLEQHPEIRDLVQPARNVSRGCGLPASIVGLAWWVFARIDETDAAFFFERLGDGQALVKGDPIYELRRTIDNMPPSRQDRTYLLAVTIKAWNAFRLGNTIGQLRFAPGGANPERFPEPG